MGGSINDHLTLGDIFQPGDFLGTNVVIAAVSGGGDSLALLFLLQAALARQDSPPRLVAITIDHALRPESSAEARIVSALCAAHNIAHETFVWQGEKPKTGLAQQARLARYHLLWQAAQQYQAKTIFTGHNLEDQAETFIMRNNRLSLTQRSGGEPLAGTIHRGLAAMPRQSWLFDQVRLIRPLLGVRRAMLRQFLQQRAMSWLEDPSNENRHYERVRIRQSLTESILATAIKTAHEAAQRRRNYNQRAITLISAMQPKRYGECYLFERSPPPCPLKHDTDELPQLVGDLASLIGGKAYLRPVPQLLRQFLSQGQNECRASRFNWSGSVIERRLTHLLIWRERRHLETCRLLPQSSILWDGRYRITNQTTNEVTVRPPKQTEFNQFIVEKYRKSALKPPPGDHRATVVIDSRLGLDFPVLNEKFEHHYGLALTRCLLPYHWLVSEDDFAFVQTLKHIFSLKIA